MDRGACRAAVHGAAKRWTPLEQLSTQHTQDKGNEVNKGEEGGDSIQRKETWSMGRGE